MLKAIEIWIKIVKIDGVKSGYILDIFKGSVKSVYLQVRYGVGK